MSTASTGSMFDPQQALSQYVLKNFYIGGDCVVREGRRSRGPCCA